MKYLDENGASRLLAKIKAYADRKVAEVDLRGGGTVEGMLKVADLTVTGGAEFDGIVSFGSDIEGFVGINGGLSTQWIEPWEGSKWGINVEGDAHFINLTVTDSFTSLSGKFDQVEIGNIPATVDTTFLLRVGEGGIWSKGIIMSATSVETDIVKANSGIFKELNVTENAVITGDITLGNTTLIGSIGSGSNGNWRIDPDGTIICEDICINSSFSNAGTSQFEAEADFNYIARFAEETYFYNILYGYNNTTLSWYITRNGWAKFARIATLPQYYQFSDIDVEQLEEENIVPAVLELIQLGPGIEALDPGLIKVLGCNKVYGVEGYIRLSIGFQVPPTPTVRGAKLTCDGMTLMTIPLSNAFKGFFEYCLPINTTNWNFNVRGSLRLEAITEIN